jgi:hypothetical protein
MGNDDSYSVKTNSFGMGVALINLKTKEVYEIEDNFLELEVY